MRRRFLGAPTTASEWEAVQANSDFAGSDFSLHIGDALNELRRFPPASINTCLTSPPYWSVRDYGHEQQVGLETELDDYVHRIVEIFREVKRVLKEDGAAWLNLGDTYYNKSTTVHGLPPESGWKRNKQLSLVPFRVAIALQDDGWWVRNVAVWQKPNAMPSSVSDRLTTTWEPVFLLTRSERYYFNLDAIRVPHVTDDEVERKRAERGTVASARLEGKGELRRWLNSPRHRASLDGLRQIDRRPHAPDPVELSHYLKENLARAGKTIAWVASELDLPHERTRHYFRTDRIGSRLPPPEVWERLKDLLDLDDAYNEAMEVVPGDNVFRNHPKGRNPGDVWAIPVASNRKSHLAVMPRKLADQALAATLPPGGTCLDPFMGTGTTALSTRALGGKFVGIEIDPANVELFHEEFANEEEKKTARSSRGRARQRPATTAS